MIDLDIARQLVATYLIDPGQEIDDVQSDGPAALVQSGTWTWRVELAPLTLADPTVVVYDVALDLMSDPGQRPTGFAQYRETTYPLSEKTGIDEFWRTVGPGLVCLDLATLIVRYHPAGASEHLVTADDAVRRVVDPASAAAVDEVGAPRCETDERGTPTAATFHTWRLHRDLTVSVHRWHVVVHTRLTWEVTTVAGDLPWRVGG